MATVLLSLQGNYININPSSLDVRRGDTVVFDSADGNHYDIVIQNTDNFFVNSNYGAAIQGTADQNNDMLTSAVNSNLPIGTTKYYTVTAPSGEIPMAPPRIIVIE